MRVDRPTTVVETKPWYTSKMLWVNMVAIVGAVGVATQTGDMEPLVVAGMGVVNFILRLITKSPLE